MRAITSVPPPAGKPTMMWTGFLITCARATGISGAMTATPQPATIVRRVSIGATPGDGAIMCRCYRYQVWQTRKSWRRCGAKPCRAAEEGRPPSRKAVNLGGIIDRDAVAHRFIGRPGFARSFRGRLQAGTRNPEDLAGRTAAWIPGSREDARPGMTIAERTLPCVPLQ